MILLLLEYTKCTKFTITSTDSTNISNPLYNYKNLADRSASLQINLHSLTPMLNAVTNYLCALQALFFKEEEAPKLRVTNTSI